MAKFNNLLFSGLNTNPIPLEFTQELSTTQWLGALKASVTEMIEYSQSLLNSTNEYTDTKVEEIMEVVNGNYATLVQLIDNTLIESKNYTDDEIDALTIVINTLTQNVIDNVARLDIKDKDLQNQIDILYNMLNKGVVFVVNPVTGQTTQIQVAVNDLYELINASATGERFTADMYDILSLTAENYETLLISAFQFDRDWKEIFYD